MKHILNKGNIDLELLFATDVLKLKSLHYGLWEKDETLSIDKVKKAQQRYTDTLMQLIPEKVKTILDVGSGIGDISKNLISKGYIVTSISPDINHKKFYSHHANLTFHNVSFEDFQKKNKFDLVLMAESNGYFDSEFGIRKSFKFLNKNGYLIISGMFNISKTQFIKSIGDTEDEYFAKAKQIGFNLIKRTDITEKVLPTLTYVHHFLVEYIYPSINLAVLYLKHSSPWKYKLLSLFFRKQIKDFDKIKGFYAQRVDPGLFKTKARYLRVIWQKR